MTATWDYDLMLKDLCKPGDARQITANPWLVSINEHTFAAATDGVRALYLEAGCAHLYPETAHLRHCYGPLDASALDDLLASAPEATHWVDRKALLAAIGPGDIVTLVIDACRACAGSGKRKGSILLRDDCHKCAGKGTVVRRSDFGPCDPLQIGGVAETIDARLVRGIFEHLRGDLLFLSVRSRDGSVFFRGPGWGWS